jgi:hypothetical protein
MAGLEEIWRTRAMKGESKNRGLSLQHLRNEPGSGQVTLKMGSVHSPKRRDIQMPHGAKNEDQHLTCSCWRKLKLIRPERCLICEITFSLRVSVSPSHNQYFDCSPTAN